MHSRVLIRRDNGRFRVKTVDPAPAYPVLSMDGWEAAIEAWNKAHTDAERRSIAVRYAQTGHDWHRHPLPGLCCPVCLAYAEESTTPRDPR